MQPRLVAETLEGASRASVVRGKRGFFKHARIEFGTRSGNMDQCDARGIQLRCTENVALKLQHEVSKLKTVE